MKTTWLVGLLGVLALAADGPRQTSALTAALLLDVSASVSQQPLRIDDRFVRVFNAFVQKLQPGDRAAVGVLTNKLRISPLSSDVRELSGSVRLLLQSPDADRLGPTPIWDALDAAIDVVADGGGRPVIILYSDGRSSGNMHGLAEVLAHAKQTGAVISAVIPPPRLPPEHLDPADLIEQLTSATGGRRLMEARLPGSAAALVAQIMEQMRK
jgi:hypothetical protein